MKNSGLVWVVCGVIAVGVAGSVMFGTLFVVAGIASTSGGGDGGDSVAVGSVETTDSIDGLKIPYPNTKLGLEGHLDDVHPKHCTGPDADPLNFAGGTGAYPPHTSEQERWYFNELWPSASFGHKKLLVTSKQTKKQVVVSVEEAGPAAWVTSRDGVGAGAPPEVLRALGFKNLSGAYDGNPQSDNNRITVEFVKDQKDAPLGPVGKVVKDCEPV